MATLSELDEVVLDNKNGAKTEESGIKDQIKSKIDSPRIKEIRGKLVKPIIIISLLVFAILNIVMFIVGITSTNDCRSNPMIPVYLTIAGAVGVLTKLIPLANYKKRLFVVDFIVGILVVFEFVWMIIGSAWTYVIYEPEYDPSAGLYYCNKTTYLLAFGVLTLQYVLLLLIIVIPCIIACCTCGCAILVATYMQ